jgi:hypothetical protein
VTIKQTVDEVEIARSAAACADSELSGQMRLGARSERGDFLVPDVDPLDLSLAPYGVSQPIEAITDYAVDALTPAAARTSTNCSATVFAIGVLHLVLPDVCRRRAAAPVPVQLSSHSVFDLVSEVTPFSTAPAVVLTVLAGPNSFASLRV